nr:MAG TPA: Putative head tail adaptor [Caudoviricetes sp.]
MRYVKDLRLSSMLKNRLDVYGVVTATEKNRLGQYPKEEKKLFSVYGAILPMTGGLLSGRQAETTLTRTTHKIVTRYTDKINPSMFIMYKGTRYDILYIMDPYLNGERLEIFCEVVL